MSRTSVDSVESLTTGHATLPRVNLLPPEVHTARKLRQLQIGLAAGMALLAVAIGGFYLLQVQDAKSAAEELNTVKARAATLEAQKAQYADVPRTIAAIENAEAARQTAMATDVAWYRYLNDLSYITPSNTWLKTLNVSFNSGTTAAATPAAGSTTAATSSPQNPGIASIAFEGVGKDHVDVARWLDAIAKEKGWADAYFTNSTKAAIGNDSTVNFTSTVTVTADALSHRFDRKAG